VRARIALAVAVAAGLASALGAERGGEAPLRAEAAQARAGKFLGGFSGIRPHGDLTAALTAKLVDRAGGNTTRSVIHWQSIEPQQDQLATAPLERLHKYHRALRKRGIRPILVLQYAPVWARDAGEARACGADDACHYPPARSMLGEWREFVAEIERRFPGAAIEIWNEPNYLGQWQSGVDPARYAELLAAADGALESVDPRRKLYAGGLGAVAKAGWHPPADFLRTALAVTPSLADHADAINLHVYPTDGFGPDSSFSRLFSSVRAVRDGLGAGHLPLLITELGLTTTGPRAASEDKQARVLLGAKRRISRMPDALGVLLYTLADRDELSMSDPERGFGAVRPGPGERGATYSPKRVYVKLKNRGADK
jgi:hypothetical protein